MLDEEKDFLVDIEIVYKMAGFVTKKHGADIICEQPL